MWTRSIRSTKVEVRFQTAVFQDRLVAVPADVEIVRIGEVEDLPESRDPHGFPAVNLEPNSYPRSLRVPGALPEGLTDLLECLVLKYAGVGLQPIWSHLHRWGTDVPGQIDVLLGPGDVSLDLVWVRMVIFKCTPEAA